MKKIDTKMTQLEDMVFQILLSSDKMLNYEEIVCLAPEDHKWNNKSIYVALNHLKEKGLIEEAGKIKVARTRAILYQATLSKEEFYEACHRQHFEQVKDRSVECVLSALTSNDKRRNEEVINEVESWLKQQKNLLKK